MYVVDDFELDPDNSNNCICSWLISRAVTKYAGTLNFAMRFACTDINSKGESEVVYSWNTTIYTGIIVADSIYNADVALEDYSDIVATFEHRIQSQFDAELEKFNSKYSELESDHEARFKKLEDSIAATGESYNKKFEGLSSDYESRFKELSDEVLAKEPISIGTITSKEAVITADKTVTPVTITKTNGESSSFGIEAQNGKDAKGLVGTKLIDGHLYILTSTEESEFTGSVDEEGNLILSFK